MLENKSFESVEVKKDLETNNNEKLQDKQLINEIGATVINIINTENSDVIENNKNIQKTPESKNENTIITKTLELAEIKKIYGETCFETETSYGINAYGKYNPRITFIVPKQFNLDKNGEPINPIKYHNDSEMTDGMNIEWDGDVDYLYGDFWKSKKGTSCFRPKDPLVANNIMFRVNWGGAFNHNRGMRGSKSINDAVYYNRASSNGGGVGYDYCIFPIGYSNEIRDEEIDGVVIDSDNLENRKVFVNEKSKHFREKHSRAMREEIELASIELHKKLAAEELSRQSKEDYIPRLSLIEDKLANFAHYYACNTGIKYGDEYFEYANKKYLYNQKDVTAIEDLVSEKEAMELKSGIQKALRSEYENKITEIYGDRIERTGLELKFQDSLFAVILSEEIRWLKYSDESLDFLSKKIKEREDKLAIEKLVREKEAEYQKKAKEAKELGLPSDINIWHRTGGLTGCSSGWVIGQEGADRECDRNLNENDNRYKRYSDGYEVWDQILQGELVIKWTKDFTAAPHVCEVVYQPDEISEAQLERVAEIQNKLEKKYEGLFGSASGKPSPPIGKGWGLFKK